MRNMLLKYLENLEGIEKKLKKKISDSKREKLLFLKKKIEKKMSEMYPRFSLEDQLLEDKF